MTPSQILAAARERITEPDAYQPGWEAHAADGTLCGFANERATAWDVVGAIVAAGDVDPEHPKWMGEEVLFALAAFKGAASGVEPSALWLGFEIIEWIAEWEHRGLLSCHGVGWHTEVLGVFDAAVGVAERFCHELARRTEAELLRAQARCVGAGNVVGAVVGAAAGEF